MDEAAKHCCESAPPGRRVRPERLHRRPGQLRQSLQGQVKGEWRDSGGEADKQEGPAK